MIAMPVATYVACQHNNVYVVCICVSESVYEISYSSINCKHTIFRNDSDLKNIYPWANEKACILVFYISEILAAFLKKENNYWINSYKERKTNTTKKSHGPNDFNHPYVRSDII